MLFWRSHIWFSRSFLWFLYFTSYFYFASTSRCKFTSVSRKQRRSCSFVADTSWIFYIRFLRSSTAFLWAEHCSQLYYCSRISFSFTSSNMSSIHCLFYLSWLAALRSISKTSLGSFQASLSCLSASASRFFFIKNSIQSLASNPTISFSIRPSFWSRMLCSCCIASLCSKNSIKFFTVSNRSLVSYSVLAMLLYEALRSSRCGSLARSSSRYSSLARSSSRFSSLACSAMWCSH